MGIFSSRQNAAVEEAEQSSNNAYKYPPRSGNFFGSHFIMGGERFDTPQPEAYLFGENADLNFLGNRPTAFPYPPPQANEPTKTLKSLVNIRKESVRFVRLPEKEEVDGNVLCIGGEDGVNSNCSYNIEFTFDSDAKCAITIYYFCTEEVSPSGVTLVPRDGLTSETYHYEKGMNQYFSQPSHVFQPQLIPEDDYIYNPTKEQYPVAIHCVVEEGNEECRQSHTTICVIDHHSDYSYVLRALKQKIFVDGLCYLLQEIYGIENKAVNKSSPDEDVDDHGSECVICMSETRDTLILPCRHLCLCNSCADSLRYQANNCPICRAPFRALLQIRAVQKGISSSLLHQTGTPAEPVCDQHVPAGYIPVSLIEALNGPPQYVVRTRDSIDGMTGGDGLNHKPSSPHKSSSQRRSKNKKHLPSSTADAAGSEANKLHSSQTVSVAELPESNLNVAGAAVTQKKSPKSEKSDKSSHRHSQDKLQIVNERNSLKMNKSKRNSACNVSMKGNNSTSTNEADEDSETEKLSPLLSPSSKGKTLAQKPHAKTVVIEPVETSNDDENDEIESEKQLRSCAGDSDEGEKTTTFVTSIKKHKRKPQPAASAVGDSKPVTLNVDADSDYYTPEDMQNSILSPLCPMDKLNKSGDKIATQAKGGNMGSYKSGNNIAMKNLHKKSTSVGNILGPNASLTAAAELKANVSSLPDMLDGPMSSGGGAGGAGVAGVAGNAASTRSSSDSYSSSSSTKQLLSSNASAAAANIIVDDKTALQNAVNV